MVRMLAGLFEPAPTAAGTLRRDAKLEGPHAREGRKGA